MTTKLTHIDKDNLIAQLRAEIITLGTALADEKNLVAALRAKIVELSARPARFDSKAHIEGVRASAQALVKQYGASNVMRVGGEFRVRTPNGAWQSVA